MKVLLRGGPSDLDGHQVTIGTADRQYVARPAGKRYVYKDSGEKDPSTGLRIFELDPDEDD
jgi:hypothetical protein